MGSESSKGLTPNLIDDLKYCTAFSGKEIRDWYEKFHQDCPSGKMTTERFTAMYKDLFPDGDAAVFAKHVFDAYDIDSNGYIDFREFLCTLSVSLRGTIDEKLKWAFNMYDIDGNGYVTKSEVKEILKAIYKMQGDIGVKDDSSCMNIEEAVDKMFAVLDKNRDDKISDLEFIIGAKSAPEILGILHAGPTPEAD